MKFSIFEYPLASLEVGNLEMAMLFKEYLLEQNTPRSTATQSTKNH